MAERRRLFGLPPGRRPLKPMLGAPLFIMGPKPNDFDRSCAGKHLINEAVLNINSARIRASQVSDELFKRWWILEWILSKNLQKCLRLRL